MRAISQNASTSSSFLEGLLILLKDSYELQIEYEDDTIRIFSEDIIIEDDQVDDLISMGWFKEDDFWCFYT